MIKKLVIVLVTFLALQMNAQEGTASPYSFYGIGSLKFKGTVENRIGQIRRFFPKKTDLRFVTIDQVQYVEDLLNNRPVRKFNYKTPNQVLLEKIALIT